MLFRIRANFLFFMFFLVLVVATTWKTALETNVFFYAAIVLSMGAIGFLAATTFCIVLNLLASNEKNGAIGPQKFEITETAFVEESVGTTTVTKWPGVQAIYEFEDVMYILISMYRMHIVPRRSFADQESFDTFVSEVRARMDAAKSD